MPLTENEIWIIENLLLDSSNTEICVANYYLKQGHTKEEALALVIKYKETHDKFIAEMRNGKSLEQSDAYKVILKEYNAYPLIKMK